MSMPEGDPIYVRAAVARRCNLDCVYCPKSEGMENRVPSVLQGQVLDTAAYVRCLEHIARQGIGGVSFTGGEPTLNADLPMLVAHARAHFQRVELTTNGLFFPAMLPKLASTLDVVKVSLDSLDEGVFSTTTSGAGDALNQARTSIEAAAESRLRVGINFVAMRSTIDHLPNIIDYARNINRSNQQRNVYVSILDFFYSPSRRSFWEREFIPTERLEAQLTHHFGSPTGHTRFGCRFLWFDAGGVEIRLKDSFGPTRRAPKCTGCAYYCQEGIYGLKFSMEGWLTTCPTNDPNYGVRLSGKMTKAEADALLHPLVHDIRMSMPESRSFSTMLKVHSLRPAAMMSEFA